MKSSEEEGLNNKMFIESNNPSFTSNYPYQLQIDTTPKHSDYVLNRKESYHYGYLDEDGLTHANVLLKQQKDEMTSAGVAIDNLNANFQMKIKAIMTKLENKIEKSCGNWLKDDLQRRCDCFSKIKGEFSKLQKLLSEQAFLASSRQAIIDELTILLNKEREASNIYNKAIKDAFEEALKTKLRLADWCFRKRTLMKYFGKLRLNTIQSRTQRESEEKFKQTKQRIMHIFTEEYLNQKLLNNGDIRSFSNESLNDESKSDNLTFQTNLTDVSPKIKTEPSNVQSNNKTELLNVQSNNKTELLNVQSNNKTELLNVQSNNKTELLNVQSNNKTQLLNVQSNNKTPLLNIQSYNKTNFSKDSLDIKKLSHASLNNRRGLFISPKSKKKVEINSKVIPGTSRETSQAEMKNRIFYKNIQILNRDTKHFSRTINPYNVVPPPKGENNSTLTTNKKSSSNYISKYITRDLLKNSKK